MILEHRRIAANGLFYKQIVAPSAKRRGTAATIDRDRLSQVDIPDPDKPEPKG
jgi:hypothetical protein